MRSGREQGEQHYHVFLAWIGGHERSSDWSDYVEQRKNQLNRNEIARECGFDRGVFYHNPRIKQRLKQLEEDLRRRKILPDREQECREPIKRDRDLAKARITEQQNAALKEEVHQLRGQLDQYKSKQEQYSLIDESMEESPRIPR